MRASAPLCIAHDANGGSGEGVVLDQTNQMPACGDASLWSLTWPHAAHCVAATLVNRMSQQNRVLSISGTYIVQTAAS